NLPGEPADFFKPEFVNRIDEIIRFRALSEEDLRRIVDIQLDHLAARLIAQRRLSLDVGPEARDWLAGAGYDPVYGARPLRRLIQRQVGDALALALLEGRYGDGDAVRVGVEGDALAFR
ncbi:MAG: hypothetical protein ACRDZQ_11975, partial [Acidimicrobiales bacterium]